jgi:hypothetical protein
MAKVAAFAGLCVVAALLAGSGSARTDSKCSTTIEIRNSGFHIRGGNRTVKLGCAVRWVNETAYVAQIVQNEPGLHPVFRSPAIDPHADWKVTPSGGAWRYCNTQNPDNTRFFTVPPRIRARHRSVRATWATPHTRTGRHFCVLWAVSEAGEYHQLQARVTTKDGGRLVRGRSYKDYGHQTVMLHKGARVWVYFKSGIHGHLRACKAIGVKAGWGEYVSSARVTVR